MRESLDQAVVEKVDGWERWSAHRRCSREGKRRRKHLKKSTESNHLCFTSSWSGPGQNKRIRVRQTKADDRGCCSAQVHVHPVYRSSSLLLRIGPIGCSNRSSRSIHSRRQRSEVTRTTQLEASQNRVRGCDGLQWCPVALPAQQVRRDSLEQKQVW